MGSVLSYETRAGKRYRVLYRRPDGSQAQKRGFTTKRSAELYLAGVETSKSAGEYVNPTDAKVSVGELAVRWLHDRQGDLKPSVYRSVESAWRIHVEPQWTNRRVGAILPSEIRAGCRHSADHTAPRPSCASMASSQAFSTSPSATDG